MNQPFEKKSRDGGDMWNLEPCAESFLRSRNRGTDGTSGLYLSFRADGTNKLFEGNVTVAEYASIASSEQRRKWDF